MAIAGATPSRSNPPDYVGLVSFLVKPFLDSPDAFRIDCETASGHSKVWIRMAFGDTDKGKVFGRGGRNIQAIRTVLEAAAKAAGQAAYLDVYGGTPHYHEGDSADKPGERTFDKTGDRGQARRSGPPKPPTKPRTRQE